MPRFHFPKSKYIQEAIMKTEVFIQSQLNISKKDLYSHRKDKNIVEARFIAYYVLSTFFQFPIGSIAETFHKENSSIIYGIDQLKQWGWDGEVFRQFKGMYPSALGVDKPVDIAV